jgi:SecD/SecF fusion protein
MGLYYLLPGLVADFALIIYALFTLAIFKGGLSWFIPAVTLTLPGIAGFILSVGMAVDANILIFERLKEELRNGKTLRLAIDSGFKRAFTAIRDSNICTIITCIILYSMGTPSVKGFALTLGIGVVVSLFTAITVTRTFLYLLVDAGADKHPEIFGLKRQWVTGIDASSVQQAGAQRINVIGKRKFFYLLSLAVIVPGIIFYFMGGLKKSIEFAGGTEVEVLLNSQSTTQTDIHKAIAGSFKDNLVQMGRDVLGPVAIIDIRDTDQHAYLRLDAALTKAGIGYRPLSHSLVSGVISKELTQNAFQAVIIASALIVLYLATAFAIGGFVAGLRFGLSAIAALLHDVLVLIGCFAILGYFLNWEIDSLFVTATLTVVGFSVHDTIVIFDRLRENLRHRLRGESFEDLANRSILQSFARSINTSFTVILTLLAMLFLGEPSTKLLVVALLIGIISGTYSSIFNATPILVDWEMYLGRRRVAFAGPQIASKPSTTSAPVQRLPENREPVGVASQSNDGAIQSGTTADGKSYKIKPKKKSGQRRF